MRDQSARLQLRVPLEQPYRLSFRTLTAFDTVLVELHDGEGGLGGHGGHGGLGGHGGHGG